MTQTEGTWTVSRVRSSWENWTVLLDFILHRDQLFWYVLEMNTTENKHSVADPDLELRGVGGGVVLIYLPYWLSSLLSFLRFLPKIRGAGPPGLSLRSATDTRSEFDSVYWLAFNLSGQTFFPLVNFIRNYARHPSGVFCKLNWFAIKRQGLGL